MRRPKAEHGRSRGGRVHTSRRPTAVPRTHIHRRPLIPLSIATCISLVRRSRHLHLLQLDPVQLSHPPPDPATDPSVPHLLLVQRTRDEELLDTSIAERSKHLGADPVVGGEGVEDVQFRLARDEGSRRWTVDPQEERRRFDGQRRLGFARPVRLGFRRRGSLESCTLLEVQLAEHGRRGRRSGGGRRGFGDDVKVGSGDRDKEDGVGEGS